MMDLYNDTCFACSKIVTNKYSTSFSLGIRAFHKKFRTPIYAIYGFVRYADEIVDTFHQHDKEKLIDDFYNQTFKAIQDGISLNPILHSFQAVVSNYQITDDLIEAFFKSMKLDLYDKSYTRDKYREYIYGSAEVIGLMCLKIFCEGDAKLYESLKSTATRLGSAFQKINFLRDLRSDYVDRGRVYFPDVSFENFSQEDKQLIEEDIQKDFDYAFEGIRKLPKGARLGVFIAYKYYKELFRKIRKSSAKEVASQRIRVSDRMKLFLFLFTFIKHKFSIR